MLDRRELQRRKRLELIVPTVLLCVGCIVVALALFQVLGRAQAHNRQMQFVGGAQQYYILQGERCVGEMYSNMTEGRVLQWQLQGTLRVREAGTLRSAKVYLESFFNPLNQLFRSVLRLEFGALRLRVGTENVHPINIDLNFSSDEVAFTRRFRLPGPILFRAEQDPNTPKQYVLDYHYGRALMPEAAQRTSTELMNTLALELVPVSEATQCEGKKVGEADALEFEGLRRLLQGISPKLLEGKFV